MRKSSSVISSSIDNIQEKLERKNAENMIRNGSDIRQDDTDGFPMSVPLLKQKLRLMSLSKNLNQNCVKFKKCKHRAGEQWC